MTDSNQQEYTEESPTPLGSLTDEQIATMSPEEIEEALKASAEEIQAEDGDSAADASEPGSDQDDAQSAAADEEEDTGSDVTGGADSDFQSLDAYGDVAGSTSADQSTDEGNEEASAEAADQGTEDDQSEAADSQADEEDDSTDNVDWKAKYMEVMATFKASGRTVKVESPDDARRLMQMGYDYTNKMREMKPHLRILKTLEHNDLLEPEKINFAIDLMKGNPEAVKKFLKDREIDPIDLDLEDSADYLPTDHRPSEEQLALDEVLDSIRETESFPRTAQVITKEWDKASQNVLMGIPSLIAVINDHMERGYYDQISGKVQYERSMGRLKGLSDLDAYKTVGDAMEADGVFAPTQANNTAAAKSGQGHSQDSKGSSDSVKSRNRAASPTTGNASAGNAQGPKNFLGNFSDEEIEAMG
jgi:hypothetical protein